MRNATKYLEMKRISSAMAASSTVYNTTGEDLAGYDGICYLVNMGALTTGTVVNAHIEMNVEATSSAYAFSDIAGSAANLLSTQFSDDAWLVTETYRPLKRYVRLVVDRATANAAINGILALKFPSDRYPVTHSTAGIAAVTLTVSASSGSAT